MNLAAELYEKIDDLAKHHRLSAQEKFDLRMEAAAVIFLVEEGDDAERQFSEASDQLLSPVASQIMTLAAGALARLRSRGIDRSNAEQSFREKLIELDKRLQGRA